MNLKNTFGVIAGTVLVAGSMLAAGAVYAAESVPTAPAAAAQPAAKDFLADAVKTGKMTQAEADVHKQLDDLRKAAMDKLKADSQAIIDQAVKDGKLTQEQADKLSKGPGGFGPHDGNFGKGHGPGQGPGAPGGQMGDHKGFGRAPLSQDELKAKLDAEVKAGKLTQEQADKMLQDFAQRPAPGERHAQGKGQSQSQEQAPSQGQGL
ncbi:MAG TPA: hypothetical protein VGK74_15105 [Symbiobacteriaceae bacterium]|jgi:polyhydroxyalkanoate synthesis regulator phasin